jgi:hypothetical protein
MFLWKDFLMARIRKIQKHKERDRSGKSKKTRRKEWRKEKKEIFPFVEVPILKGSPEGGSHWHEGSNLPYNLLTRYKGFKNMVPSKLPKCSFDS